MSKYEWERGTIKIPTKAWARFRTALIKKHNALQMAKFERALSLHKLAKKAAAGKRGAARNTALLRIYESVARRDKPDTDDLLHMLFDYSYVKRQRICKLKKAPKKQDFKTLPTTKDARLDCEDGTIYLCNAERTVTWSVDENNRACEHARKHPLARKLFRLLDRIEWTRGSGGEIVGNDEYNRDCYDEGGGGNYVTASFGPKKASKKPRKKVSKKPRSGYSNMGGGGPFAPFGGRRW